jgi:hypothetical protein
MLLIRLNAPIKGPDPIFLAVPIAFDNAPPPPPPAELAAEAAPGAIEPTPPRVPAALAPAAAELAAAPAPNVPAPIVPNNSGNGIIMYFYLIIL